MCSNPELEIEAARIAAAIVDYVERTNRPVTLSDIEREVPGFATNDRSAYTVMRELGWTPVRVRDLTRGGYKEQVRGYCRDARMYR